MLCHTGSSCQDVKELLVVSDKFRSSRMPRQITRSLHSDGASVPVKRRQVISCRCATRNACVCHQKRPDVR